MTRDDATEAQNLTFSQRSLVQQGYADLTPEQYRELDRGLRFTPTACAAMTLYGLATGNASLLFLVACLGVWAFLAPAAHPMDLLYNHGVCRITGSTPLPPNPLQRRLACLSAAFMNAGAGYLLLQGRTTLAYLLGGTLLVFQVIVISTHFCALSWIYEILGKIVKGMGPLEPEKVRELLEAGATVIDVRTPPEYAADHLEGVANHPLDRLEADFASLPQGVLLVHCQSGMRSRAAVATLQRLGREDVHDIGSLARARQILSH